VISEFEAAARKQRIQLNTVVIHNTDELKSAFATFHKQRTNAILVFGNLFTYKHRRLIADLALERNLPTMCDAAGWVQEGSLMAYYPPLSELFRLTGGIVDRVLRGTDASEVPIQQPTVFALSVNFQTAKALRLNIPSSVLVQASELVE